MSEILRSRLNWKSTERAGMVVVVLSLLTLICLSDILRSTWNDKER